jgi:hypothetical protein
MTDNGANSAGKNVEETLIDSFIDPSVNSRTLHTAFIGIVDAQAHNQCRHLVNRIHLRSILVSKVSLNTLESFLFTILFLGPTLWKAGDDRFYV